MEKILSIITIFVMSCNFVAAITINPINDSFSSTTLNSTLWTVYASANYGYSLNGTQMSLTGSGCGGTELRSNYYLIGDFDTQIDAYRSTSGAGAYYTTFRFFKYGVTNEPSTHGTTWGYAGNIYSWFPQGSAGWSYSASGSTSYQVGNQWHQLRIQRVGNDIFTYNRLVGSPSWTLQNSYLNFGSNAVFLSFIAGDGSSGTSNLAYADNFVGTGYADTNALATPSIPEPASLFLLSLSILFIFKKK